MSAQASIDESLCPVCKQPNRCAVLAGQPVESCWCHGASIPAAALAAIPESLQGKACLCPSCAQYSEVSTRE